MVPLRLSFPLAYLPDSGLSSTSSFYPHTLLRVKQPLVTMLCRHLVYLCISCLKALDLNTSQAFLRCPWNTGQIPENTLAAVVLIRTLDQDKRVHRRQQDNLPKHVKGKAYFENHGTGHKDTRYYVDLPKKTHGVIEFVKVEDKDYWVKLLWKNDQWITNQGGVLHTSKLGNWTETDLQHPHYIHLEHFSPTLYTATEQPEEEILAGGVHHIATLQGSHPFTEQAPILPQIEAAVYQGIPIPLDTTPAGAVHPQLSIQTTMAEQIDTTIAGPEGQQQPNINVINHNSNGALKGNPPPIFDGDRSKSRTFLTAFYLWRITNKHNDTMRKPYSCVTALLSYMNGPQVDSWKEEQLDKLIAEIDDGTQETDEVLWDNFIESFKQAYTNTNLREEVYQALCKLRQKESLDEFFTKFKRLARDANVALNDWGTIELLKNALAGPLTKSVIQLPGYDVSADPGWTFKKWEEEARKQHLKWKTSMQYTKPIDQRWQAMYRAFGINPNRGGNPRGGNTNGPGCRTTSQGGYHMDVDATKTGRGVQHSEAKKNKLMARNQCFYCEIRGHCAKDCQKKQADRCNYERGTNNSPGNNRSTNYPGKSKPTTNHAIPSALDMTPEDISSFLKDNMGSLDEDTKLSIVESLMPKDFTKAQN